MSGFRPGYADIKELRSLIRKSVPVIALTALASPKTSSNPIKA